MKNIKGLFLFLLLFAAFMLLAGCGSSTKPSEEVSAEPEQTEPAEPPTVMVSHKLGEALVTKNPAKVVVFDYATLDTLDSTGIEIAALPKSNIPEYLNKYKEDKYTDVGTLFEPNYEKLSEMKPGIIFISARQASVYEELKKIAPVVYFEIDQNDYISSFEKNLLTLGDIFDKKDYAEAEASRIKKEVEELNKKVTALGRNALVLMANEGAFSAYGTGSRFGVIHKEFGFAAADPEIEVSNHGQSVSFEYIVEKNPDYIFVIDRAATAGGSTSAEQVLDNDLVKMTKAYQEQHIIYLSS